MQHLWGRHRDLHAVMPAPGRQSRAQIIRSKSDFSDTARRPPTLIPVDTIQAYPQVGSDYYQGQNSSTSAPTTPTRLSAQLPPPMKPDQAIQRPTIWRSSDSQPHTSTQHLNATNVYASVQRNPVNRGNTNIQHLQQFSTSADDCNPTSQPIPTTQQDQPPRTHSTIARDYPNTSWSSRPWSNEPVSSAGPPPLIPIGIQTLRNSASPNQPNQYHRCPIRRHHL